MFDDLVEAISNNNNNNNNESNSKNENENEDENENENENENDDEQYYVKLLKIILKMLMKQNHLKIK